MLKKSHQSAIVMSGVAVLSSLSAFLFWELRRYPSAESPLTQIQSYSSSDRAMLFLALLVILVLVVLPGAFLIRNWSAEHFGTEGLLRWTLFGILFGSLGQVRVLIPEGTLEKGYLSFLLDKGLSLILGFIFLYLSHSVAFKLLKWRVNPAGE